MGGSVATGMARAACGLLLALMSFASVALAAADASAQEVNTITATRIVGDETRTRFVADLTGTIQPRVFTLADPYRIVIDLPEVRFQLAAGTGEDGFALIQEYRFGLISRGQSRIVLDVTQPVEVANVFVTEADAGQPARLVVDLVSTTREAFLADALQYQQQTNTPAPALDGGDDGRLVLVIDPGHGGIDPGAIGANNVYEKNVVLAFAQELASQLEATGRYEVLLTREDDTFLTLTQRVEFARAASADILLSIHADAFPQQAAVRGTAVFTLSERASNQMVADIAARENRADILAGVNIQGAPDEVADILIDFMRRETKNFSIVLARNIVDSLRGNTTLAPYPQQEADFMVLKAPDVPSVLIELGFLTNSQDEELLQSQAWRQSTASSMVTAINQYFATRVAGNFAR
jgi:N-acetylmuramoyl-L-alanine amidase